MLAITTVLLVGVFISAEFYRFRSRITGSVREICPLDGDPTGLAGACLRVRTSDANEVTAFVSGCQMCICRIAVGDTVSLVPGPNGYILRSPWITRRPNGACPKGVAS